MKNKVYLGLGSNKGDKATRIKEAVYYLNAVADSEVTKCSLIYETSPCGEVKQDNYYNAVCEFQTGLSLPELFNTVKNIEITLGRKESEKWGPREIDIDILLYNDLIYEDERLIVPHKEMLKRDFVVIPLVEINPDIVHPVLNVKLSGIKFNEEEKHILNILDIRLFKNIWRLN
jgi:2-amino-4-hydroxy-6-hydroxymethyldihydropteridine diphosphokinase